MEYAQPDFGNLFSTTIPMGNTGQDQSASGPPLGKVTIDTTPQLTARIDRLTQTTENVANQAQLTGLLGLGLVALLGVAYVRRCG